MTNRIAYLTTPHPLDDGLRAQYAVTEVANHLIVAALAMHGTMLVMETAGTLRVSCELWGVESHASARR